MSDYLWSNRILHAYLRQIVVRSAEDRQNDCRFFLRSIGKYFHSFHVRSCEYEMHILNSVLGASAHNHCLLFFALTLVFVCPRSFDVLWVYDSCAAFFSQLLTSHHIDSEYLCVCFSTECVEIVKRKELLWIMLSNSVLKFYCLQTEAI